MSPEDEFKRQMTIRVFAIRRRSTIENYLRIASLWNF